MKDSSGGFLLAFMGGFLCGSSALICFIIWSVFKCCPPRRRANQLREGLRLLKIANAIILATDGNPATTVPQVKPDQVIVDIQEDAPPPTYEETVMQGVEKTDQKIFKKLAPSKK